MEYLEIFWKGRWSGSGVIRMCGNGFGDGLSLDVVFLGWSGEGGNGKCGLCCCGTFESRNDVV